MDELLNQTERVSALLALQKHPGWAGVLAVEIDRRIDRYAQTALSTQGKRKSRAEARYRREELVELLGWITSHIANGAAALAASMPLEPTSDPGEGSPPTPPPIIAS